MNIIYFISFKGIAQYQQQLQLKNVKLMIWIKYSAYYKKSVTDGRLVKHTPGK